MIVIDVANDFSRTPFGRYRTDGENSAERFRVDILEPKIEKNNIHEDFRIDFSKVALGVGSSFLEEVFGGLVRDGYSKKDLLKHITVVDKTEFYDQQVKHFIEVACQQNK